MKRAILLSILFLVFAVNNGFAQVPECCLSCSCTLCGDLAACQDSPYTPSTFCHQYPDPGGDGCGTGTPDLCDEWYDNSSFTGTLVDSYSSTSGTNPCIPIDGGLGFLIAGGLGIGVIGIRRRNEGLQLQAA